MNCRVWIAALAAAAVCVIAAAPMGFAQEQYLLMKPIGSAVNSGNFGSFKDICQEKISITLEPPFKLNGYFYTEKFIEDINHTFKNYKTIRIEWASKQIEDRFAVQSLNVILKHKRSEKTVYYKFIFFMNKGMASPTEKGMTGDASQNQQEWKIYYFRGLNI
jgi:hypothetical protein